MASRPAACLILALWASSHHPDASLSFLPGGVSNTMNSLAVRSGVTSKPAPTALAVRTPEEVFAGLVFLPDLRLP